MKFSKDEMPGRHILVGIVYRREDGSVERVVQEHGTVTAVEGNSVEYVPNGRSESIRIPYNPNFYEDSDPDAVYTLASSGEEVENVDIIARFEVRTPKQAVA
ncbi:MAG: hypothetical protein HZA20_06170 [Nitrospirae bacterium]|nr:hypothetical protein [Nitrospirota bacterium]